MPYKMPGVTIAEPEVPGAVKPLPLHEVALVELHERVDDCPRVIEVGLADSVAVGAGSAVTVTVAVAVADPPVPAQVIE